MNLNQAVKCKTKTTTFISPVTTNIIAGYAFITGLEKKTQNQPEDETNRSYG